MDPKVLLPIVKKGGGTPLSNASTGKTAAKEPAKPKVTSTPVNKPKSTVLKNGRKSFSVSVSGMLSGDKKSENATAQTQTFFKKEEPLPDKDFTQQDLDKVWKVFVGQFNDQPRIKSTLATVPVLKENCLIELPIDNSVQEQTLWEVKPKLVGFLHRQLQNSKIDVVGKIVKTERKRTILTDDEKLKAMIKTNPDLVLMRKKFNLDFSE
ncbi:hypothetical protein EYV94_01740 [Puteibacter caeruleilacunae]|nr:hypothetical protein EYV94_01740 [Puteibacter caeruleilacunae]